MSNRIQKAFATITMTAMTVSLSGIAAFVPVVAHAATPAQYGLTEGDTIRALTSGNDPDIYIVNDFGYKRLFVNPAIFNLYGHLGWDKVKEVSVATRDAFPTSGLFRNCENGDPKVYGLDVISEDVANLRWVNTSGAQAVMDDPNFFLKVFCINNSEQALYGVGPDYTSVNQVRDYNRSASPTPTPSAQLSVSLSSDNPASTTFVSDATADASSQARADLAHFTFSGTGNVTNLVFKRLGVSADTTLENVYLYEGEKRLTDAASVTSGMITFNDPAGIFAVAGSKNIRVLADINAGTSGQTVGVQLTSMNGSAVGPLSGNLHSIASATLATVTLSSSTTPAANTDLAPADDVIVWQNTATIGTRYVWLRSLQFRVIGSVSIGDLRDFRFYVDGVEKGSAVAQTDANGYVVFDFSSSPIKLETGGRVLKLQADVIGGSTRNFTVSLRQASDIYAVDSEFNAGIRATASGSFPVNAGQQTIDEGTLTFTKRTDSPSGDVVKDASGVTLARYDVKATGESMKVENLRLSYTASDGNISELRNGAVFLDGVQIGSTQELWEDSHDTTAYTQYSFGSSFIVVPGTPRIMEIRADIFDGDGTDSIDAGETIQATIVAHSSTNNVQRLTSLGFTSLPAAATPANALTVRIGSFTAGKYTGYANQSVVDPRTNFKMGHFTLTAASSEAVNVNTLNIDSDDSSGTFTAADLTDVYVKVYNDLGTLILTTSPKATVSATASNSYSVNFTLPQNKTYQIEVWANIGSSIDAGDSMNLELDATGTTAASSTAVSATAADGQTITAQNGTLTTTTASVPAAALRAGGTTATVYSYNLQPQFDDFTIDEVYVDLSSTLASSTGAVANLFLRSGSTTLGSATINATTSSASFTGLNYLVTQTGGTKTFTVDVEFAGVGIGGNDTGGNVTLRLDGLKYRDSAGTVTTTNGLAPASYTGSANLVHKTYPTFANAALPSTVLIAGQQTLFKTVMTPVGGTVSLKKLVFTVTTTDTPTITDTSFKLFENGVDVTSLTGGVATASKDFDTAGVGTGTVSFVFTNERPISVATTYELKGTIVAAGTADSVVTSIAQPSTSAITDDYTTVAATTASVVWSDMSAASHDAVATTDDWMNDYLIQTIASGQALSN